MVLIYKWRKKKIKKEKICAILKYKEVKKKKKWLYDKREKFIDQVKKKSSKMVEKKLGV